MYCSSCFALQNRYSHNWDMCWCSSYQMDRLQLFVLLLWMPNCLLCGISSSPHYSVVGLLLKILKLGMYFYSGCTWAELAFSTLRFSSKFDVFQIKLCWCQYQIEAPTFIGLRLASTLHIRCRYSFVMEVFVPIPNRSHQFSIDGTDTDTSGCYGMYSGCTWAELAFSTLRFSSNLMCFR